MTLGPRAKLLLLVSVFALPMIASYVAYMFFRPEATANYGELLLPPAMATSQPFERMEGGAFLFDHLRGKWVLVASDSGACPAECREKLHAMTQTRLALGRNAGRVERVLVVDDVRAPDSEALSRYPGLVVAVTRRGLSLPPGAANDLHVDDIRVWTFAIEHLEPVMPEHVGDQRAVTLPRQIAQRGHDLVVLGEPLSRCPDGHDRVRLRGLRRRRGCIDWSRLHVSDQLRFDCPGRHLERYLDLR